MNKEDRELIVNLYVDELIFIGNNKLMFTWFKHFMKHEFDMTNLGIIKYFLGLEVLQKSNGIFISQKSMIWRYRKGLKWIEVTLSIILLFLVLSL